MTYRELFFNLKKSKNKYLADNVIKSILIKDGGFNDFFDLIKHFDDEVKNEKNVNENVIRIKNGEPYQYVLEEAYFVSGYYKVNKGVLIPRQETEQLAVSAWTYIVKLFGDYPINIVDVGTGSGILAIYLKEKFPNNQVYGIDISEKAIDVAAENASLHNVGITLFHGNLIEPLIKLNIKCDVLISNPPYIENIETIDKQVWNYEPHLALLAKPKTLYYEEIFKHVDEIMNERYFLAFEIGEDMEKELTLLINKYLPGVVFNFEKDIYNKTRFLYIIKK